MASNRALKQALRMLGAEYEREITPGLIDAWLGVFGEVPDERFTAACDTWLRTERKFPRASDLLSRCAEQPMSVEAEDAWARLLKCSDYTPDAGAYWSPERVRGELGDAVHRAVLESGGYVQLRRLGEPQDEFWMRKRFVEAYGALRADGYPALEAGPAPSLRFALAERTGEPAIPIRQPAQALPARPSGLKVMPRAAVLVEATEERKRQLIEALGTNGSDRGGAS